MSGCHRCWLCGERRAWGAGAWCHPCNVSYDRALERGDGTVLAAIRWAVERARSFERRRARASA